MELRPLALCLVLVALAPESRANEPCAPLDKAGVAALFDGWNLALATLDPDAVSRRYWNDAVLLPTTSNTPRTNPAMIREHLVRFLEQRPRGRIDTRTVQLGCNLALDTGTYTFSVMGPSGALSEVAARYTFVYAFRDGDWKIAHHHSSAMPEIPGAASPPEVAAQGAKTAAATATKAGAATPARAGAAGEREARAAALDASRMFLNTDASPDVMEFYPAESRSSREAGKVAMRVCANPDGALVGEPKVLRSSGYDRLDVAARRWAQAAKWVPATVNQRTVEGCTEVTAAFRP
jgi:uncharacterized protein (TIGR02246 family)